MLKQPQARPETAEYRYRHGAHELRLTSQDVDHRIAEAIARGEAEFGVRVAGPNIVLGYRFGEVIPWGDAAPFQWWQLPAEERVIPPAIQLDPESYHRSWATLWITLVEAADGTIRARRAVALRPEFARALHDAIRAQALRPHDEAQRAPGDRPRGLSEEAIPRVRAAAASRPGWSPPGTVAPVMKARRARRPAVAGPIGRS